MDQRIKQLWIDELENPERKQGKWNLRVRYTDGIIRECCLGVLMDIYAKEKGLEWKLSKFGLDAYELEGESSVLTEGCVEWSKLGSEDGIIQDPEEPRSLVSCNDRYGMTFEQIADVIRRSL